MYKTYLTLSSRAQAVYEEKKSEFIATASPVENDEQAREFVAEIRSKYPDARHNVYAYLTVDGMTRYSDDGEPKGTGGVPVLSVITKANLLGAAVVVTRYFGGILLGAGGLARAYTKAAADSLIAAGTVTVAPYRAVQAQIPYSDSERVKYELSFFRLPEYETEYSECVTYRLFVCEEDCARLTARLTDVTGGRAKLLLQETVMKREK